MQHKVFLSYHTPDYEQANRLREALQSERSSLDIYFAPQRNTLGAYWIPDLGEQLDAADTIILLLGKKVGPWQELEYYDALRRNTSTGGRPLIVPVVLTDRSPGLRFLDLHHLLFAGGGDIRDAVAPVLRALDGVEVPDTEPPWRHENPYKGLAALDTEDARFFFGREALTAGILERLMQQPDRLIALIGSSGVGKSSLAQAGVIASLQSQFWPTDAAWPAALADSRAWLPITIRPGDAPLKALAIGFVCTYLRGAEAEEEASKWAKLLLDASGIEDLLRTTSEEISQRSGEPPPARYLVYVDQGEELYARAEPGEAQRFSALLASAVAAPSLVVMSSFRSDYYGQLQADADLFSCIAHIDVPPMRQGEMEDILRRPAAALGATFEDDDVVPFMAKSAGSEAGSLPLVADLMTDAWSAMQANEDGVLKLSLSVIDLSAPLAQRADQFLREHDSDEEPIKRLLTLKLAHVPVEGEPVRRRARRDECTRKEWALVEALAAARLVTTRGDEDQATAEVAHEALLRKWPTLADWLHEARNFLIWKGRIEQERRDYDASPDPDALLQGRALTTAREWLAKHEDDLAEADVTFVKASIERVHRRHGLQALVLAAVLTLIAGAGYVAQLADHERYVWGLKFGFTSPEMVVLEGGTFLMGSPETEEDRRSTEGPQHWVKVSAFAIGKTEVTFEDYDQFLKNTGRSSLPNDKGWGRENRPVFSVSWDDAVAYAAWMSEWTGESYRLPSEAEWEYAARAGTVTRYWWGDEVLQDGKVWANCHACDREFGDLITAPVGSFSANDFGLHDTAGNVFEWVQDCYVDSYEGALVDGSAREEPDCHQRVIRGGSWAIQRADSLRSASRFAWRADSRGDDLGFRLARDR